MPSKDSGFTLVEILVVITIIAVLAVIGAATYNNTLNNTRDAKRRADVQSLAKALEFKYSDTTSSYTDVTASDFTKGAPPTPPEGGEYYKSFSTGNKAFRVCATLTGGTPGCSSNSNTCYCKDSIQNEFESSSYSQASYDGEYSQSSYSGEYTQSSYSGGGSSCPTENLGGYWKFDNSFVDSSGNGNNGSDNNVDFAEGKLGASSGSFNGSAFVSIATSEDIPLGNNPYTYSAWIRPENLGSSQGIIGLGSWGTNNAVNAFGTTNNGLINYWWGNDLNAVAGSLNNNNWHYVTATFDGTTRRIYHNGSLMGSDTPDGKATTFVDFNIGRNNISEYFIGRIDEVGVWTRALSQSEISTLYNGGTGLTCP